MGLRFVDVSSWQHPPGSTIDWGEVKGAGFVGVIVKATQGTDYTNPFFSGDVVGAHGAGLLVGAYHYAQPAQNADFQREVDHFLRVAQVHDLELGAWLDWEDSGGQPWGNFAGWCESFLNALAEQVSPSGLYTNQAALHGTFGAPWAHHLWIADPSGTYDGNAWARQRAPEPVAGITSGPVDVSDLLAGRGLNPNGPDAPEHPAPAPAPPPEPPAPEPPAPPAPPTPPQEVTVQVPQVSAANPGPNVSSGAVRAVQATLASKWGHTGLVVDGRFGPATDAAVRTFQGQHGLAVDGIVGPQSWNALVNG